MIKKIVLKNFKSFKNLTFDLSGRSNNPKNIIAIYGENGAGKSNLIDVFKLLRLSKETLKFATDFSFIQKKFQEEIESSHITLEEFKNFTFPGQHTTFQEVSENTHRLSTDANTELYYYFDIDGSEAEYFLEYDSSNILISESLDFVINKNKGQHFKINKLDNDLLDINLNKVIFKGSVRKDLINQAQKLWGKHTFLSVFSEYLKSINKKYSENNISSNINKILNEIDKISIWTYNMKGPFHDDSLLLTELDKGEIDKKDKDKLLRNEEMIYQYFSMLYTDIKDVKYEIVENGNKLKYNLYFIKNVGGDLTKVPFNLESNGTKNLLELLTVFYWITKGRICLIDEIDSGIHDILMNSVLESISNSITGQMIFTTHDTALLKKLKSSSAYFMNIDALGNKKIIAGNQIDQKVAANNNMEKLYLEGLFGAVPDPLCFDFRELFDESLGTKEGSDED